MTRTLSTIWRRATASARSRRPAIPRRARPRPPRSAAPRGSLRG